ncbi:IPT/TIG domain-containing protein [Mucilaginibacter sp. dw_454]|uniref:IPT/TIG domain-containing protein n=1 Tax=Mucilaginibacter sp. dw_454 TaxID=2720079 RepID=UPI001BD363FB|nr:IPT/TIG domain-containing protein [Mucilaginibacter sp. dw_454]
MVKNLLTFCFFLFISSYVYGQVISSFSPTSGAIGAIITINGSNLDNITSLKIGGVNGIVISHAGNKVIGMVMPGAITGNLSVTTSNGVANASNTFTITTTPEPATQKGTGIILPTEAGYSAIGSSLNLSADGNTLAIAGSSDPNYTGGVWIFVRNGNEWVQQGGKLTAPEAGYINFNSGAISADGNTLLTFAGQNAGNDASWVYTRNNGIWAKKGDKLTIGEPIRFTLLSADANTVAVGGKKTTSIFVKNGQTWVLQAKLNGAPGQNDAVALSADGNTLVQSGTGDGLRYPDGTAAAVIYARNGTTWVQQGGYLSGTNPDNQTFFGNSAAINADGNILIVGSDIDNYYPNQPKFWVFMRTNGIWTQQGSGIALHNEVGDKGAGDNSALAISADGSTVLIGAPRDGASETGATWILKRNGNTWSDIKKNTAAFNAVGEDWQGYAVGMTSDASYAVVGNVRGGIFWEYTWQKLADLYTYEYPNNITTTSATISGTVNSNGSDCTVSMDYGIKPDLSASINATLSGTSNVVTAASATKTFSAKLTGLTPNTTYYYRINGVNSAGANTGSILSFVTLDSPPVIKSFSPTSAARLQKVVIKGSNLSTATEVRFGGYAASSFVVDSATQITATLNYAVSGNVSVTTSGGTASLAGFTFLSEPSISSFSPTTAAMGQTIAIKGLNFNGVTDVKIGGSSVASFVINSSTQITAVIGNNASGMVTVNSAGGNASLSGFTYISTGNSNVVITSFTPPAAGTGQTIVINGGNFTGTTAVTIGGAAAKSFTVVSATVINAQVANNTSNGSISVITPSGTATLTGFTYIQTPVISAFTPKSGGAGTSISITGTNFTNATAVTFGGTPAKSFIVNSATSITAIVASGASGLVSVTTPGGTNTSSGFVYTEPPNITSFLPLTASAGQTITINGANFTNVTGVKIGGIAASSFTIISDTEITAIVGNAANGSVVVTNANGSGTLAGFTYQNNGGTALSITSFTPKSGGIGTVVTITGSHFTGTTAVYFGQISAQSFSVLSDNTIVAIVGKGETGNVAVQTATSATGGGVFQYTENPLPVVTSVTPAIGTEGTTVIITGSNFSDVKTIVFGNTGTSNFKQVTATSITLVLNNMATNGPQPVTVETLEGNSNPAGIFTAVPKLDIRPSGTINVNPGENTLLQVTNWHIIPYTYQWAKNGIDIPGATDTSYMATDTGHYTAKCIYQGYKSISDPVLVRLNSISALPTVISVDNLAGIAGSTINITGTNFVNVKSVSFGNTPAASYTVTSSSNIQVVVGTGSSGDITVTTATGSATYAGFTFVPIPTVSAASPTTILSGKSVVLHASPDNADYIYKWYKDGILIDSATTASYKATKGGSYYVMTTFSGVYQQSAPITVTEVFDLPPTNFSLTVNSVTCKGSANGIIKIEAAQKLNYTGTITGGGLNKPYPFDTSTQITDLGPGTYNICITVAGQPTFQQCFTATITEPKDLSVYTNVIKTDNQVTIGLNGASTYNINLNGQNYTTDKSEITLPLAKGNNKLTVSTDRLCQGVVQKIINNTQMVIAYPNPVQDIVNLDIGTYKIQTGIITVYTSFGRVMYTTQFSNKSGIIPLDLTSLQSGDYILKLSADNTDTVLKIIKK